MAAKENVTAAAIVNRSLGLRIVVTPPITLQILQRYKPPTSTAAVASLVSDS